MKVLQKTFGFFLKEIKQISADSLASLPEEEVASKLDFLTDQISEIFGFLGEICLEIEKSLKENQQAPITVNFVGFFKMGFLAKGQLFDNFVELAVHFIQILKFIIKSNSQQAQGSEKTEARYLKQAKEVF